MKHTNGRIVFAESENAFLKMMSLLERWETEKLIDDDWWFGDNEKLPVIFSFNVKIRSEKKLIEMDRILYSILRTHNTIL